MQAAAPMSHLRSFAMFRTMLCVVLLSLVASAAHGDERWESYFKEGKLTAALEVHELQGGFAGFTGKYYTIARDGSWTSGDVGPNEQREKPAASGKVKEKELQAIAVALAKNDLGNLPNHGTPITNHTITRIIFGKRTAELLPEGKEPKVIARYEAIAAAVKKACQP
jgi:hypothetical protein